ncbi:MAG: NAD-dependent epimerase/dehydratase family protein [Promethearchaeota archaeon]
MKKKVIITGGSGKIGESLVSLLNKEYEVSVFDMEPPKSNTIKFIKGNINKLDDLINAFVGTDCIIHLAAIPGYTGNDRNLMEVNVNGTFNVLEAAVQAKVSNFIFTSSVCASGSIRFYQKNQLPYFPIDEKYNMWPDDMYGLGKLMGEQMCFAYSSRYNIKTICLRLATVLLPSVSYIENSVKNIKNPEYPITNLAGAPFTLKNNLWQYVDPRDLTQAYNLSIKFLEKNKEKFNVFNIGAKDVLSMEPTKKLINKYFPNVGIKSEYNNNNYWSLFSIDKANKILGYNPNFTWRDFKKV